jgi:transposase
MRVHAITPSGVQTAITLFTPTYSSWISQVERSFAELQRHCLDRGVFCSLDELTAALGG